MRSALCLSQESRGTVTHRCEGGVGKGRGADGVRATTAAAAAYAAARIAGSAATAVAVGSVKATGKYGPWLVATLLWTIAP